MSMSGSFQQFVGDFGEYSWVVLFVKAPIDAVSDVYSSAVAGEITRNVPVTIAEGALHAPIGAVVQVSDGEWVLVFHLVGQWEAFDAASLAGKLDAQVLEFAAEDTSGAIECRLYLPGEGITRYQTSTDSEYADELADEMGEYADEAGVEMEQPTPGTVVASYEKLFQSLGIRTVELTLAEDRSVVANKEHASRIDRVDLAGQRS